MKTGRPHLDEPPKRVVVIVNMEEVDFVEDSDAVIELVLQIGSALYRGINYYRADRPELFDE